MKIPITIIIRDIILKASLDDTECARSLAEKLPLSAPINLWGEEVYFEIPFTHDLDDTATETVSQGDIGYWPPGKALCFFFGKTPASTGSEIRAASPVNLVGKVSTPFKLTVDIRNSDLVRVMKA